MTTYLSDEIWNDSRDALAGSLLLRVAAGLLAGQPVEPTLADLVENAREAANLQMANINLMPESCREAEAA